MPLVKHIVRQNFPSANDQERQKNGNYGIWSLRSFSLWQWIAKLKAHVHTRAQPNTTNTRKACVSLTHMHRYGGHNTHRLQWKSTRILQFPNHHILFYMCKRGEMNRNVEIKKKNLYTLCFRCSSVSHRNNVGLIRTRLHLSHTLSYTR